MTPFNFINTVALVRAVDSNGPSLSYEIKTVSHHIQLSCQDSTDNCYCVYPVFSLMAVKTEETECFRREDESMQLFFPPHYGSRSPLPAQQCLMFQCHVAV